MMTIHSEGETIDNYPVLVKEFSSKIHKLISSLTKKDRLEASGIQFFGDHYYVVFDNISSIGKLHVSLQESHHGNELIPGPAPIEQFEDITYSGAKRRFYVVVENAEFDTPLEQHADCCFKPQICEYDEQFNPLETYPVEYVFRDKNKGLEGLALINHCDQEYLLGLCESAGGNAEGGKQQTQYGIATLLVLKKFFKKSSAHWRVERLINLPKTVQFCDYAGLDIQNNRVAVVSQVSATLWVGYLKENSWEFLDEGRIFQFPRSKKDHIKYCNVEGVTWIDRETIAVVTDKRKSADASRCKKKDQSIHIFKIPI